MNVTVDTTNFNKTLKELSRLTGVDMKQVVLAETAAVLKKTISNQMAADADKIRARKISSDRIKELLARRGLAKQSWLAIAKKLGLSIEAPAYVSKVLVKGTSYDQKVAASQKPTSGTYLVTIENSMLATIASQGRTALIKAVNGRVGYFRNNLRRGVFEKVATMAKKYPGVGIRGI